MPASTAIPNLLCYEDLVDAQPDDFEWPVFDEETASSLCYTSGTTGNPKGVLYSHRSTVLHTYASALPDALNLSARDVVLPVGADVPRQRLGPAVFGLHGRRAPGAARPGFGRRVAV
jgi:acyl-CoA synthetase (AMP-forming)/AMP-acid ligase II